MSGAPRQSYYCTPFECVPKFGERLTVWQLMNQTIQRVLFAGQSKGLYRTAFSCTMQISHSFSRLDHGKFCQIDLDQDHAKLESLTFVETLLTCTCTSTAFTVTDANDFSGGVTTHLCGVVSSDLGERKVPRFFSKFGVELFKI